MKRTNYTKKDFLWTQWQPNDIKKVIDEFIINQKRKYTEIKKISANNRTFKNTILALEISDYNFIDEINKIHLLMEVSPKKKVRQACQKYLEAFNRKMVDIEYDEEIYQAILDYQKKKEKIKGEDKKLFDDMLIGYKRMGFSLLKKKRKELQKNLKKLGKLSNDFSQNINEYNDFILVSKKELGGLSENYIKGLKKKGSKYIITLEYPDYVPFMANAQNDLKRKELADKALQKGGKINIQLLEKILKVRDKNAKLLGYKNHVAYRTETRLVENEKKVFTFISSLISKLESQGKKDIKELKEFKKKAKKDGTLQHYDISYYSNQLRKEKFDIDSEKIREYFPLEYVKKGLFKIYSHLFSVKFQKLNDYKLWHRDVEIYTVKDLNNKIISYFILDLYPREGKYGHAMMTNIVKGRQSPENKDLYISPIGCLVTNFPKPKTKIPSLMSHGEVETFFHEFGHLMHGILTKAKYLSNSGTSVSQDFVEAPSQMLENWVWDKKMLKILSKHYKTSETLPKIMLDNLLRIKYYMVYYQNMRQLIFSLFDFKIHSQKIKNISYFYNQLIEKYTGIKMPKKSIFPAGFGHLMGYDAGYYSYLWSRVYAADMFSRFQKEGLLNKKTGMDYRKWILEKGSSDSQLHLVQKFLKRKPNNKAFLKEIGL